MQRAWPAGLALDDRLAAPVGRRRPPRAIDWRDTDPTAWPEGPALPRAPVPRSLAPGCPPGVRQRPPMSGWISGLRKWGRRDRRTQAETARSVAKGSAPGRPARLPSSEESGAPGAEPGAPR
jgi:hypothetical protein